MQLNPQMILYSLAAAAQSQIEVYTKPEGLGVPPPNRKNDNAAQRQRSAKKRRKARGRK